ncbi:hypothetical protein [Granulicella arctica]|uniref:Uncharacterized protein n=1 Tax=Granulicella arctica TaxID=940613 RepID=A0A7Y9TFL2_9BACT|nr:hypothetical protein [Granulicella arctica]NYF78926.1 hypothetical protein [Granulicella arctica]
MKPRIYEIRVSADKVSVKYRMPLWNLAIAWIVAALYIGYASICCIRKLVEPIAGASDFSSLLLSLPFALLFAFRSITMISGEVLQCNAHELHLARRRIWGRWQHLHYPSARVRCLQWAVRSAGRSSYTVLTFQYDGQTIDILKGLTWTDGDRILRACRSMGVDTIIDETDAAMRRDIDRRGWWVNPLRPDSEQNHPSSH